MTLLQIILVRSMVGLLLLVVVLVAIDMFKTIREYEVSELTRKGGKDCRDHHQP